MSLKDNIINLSCGALAGATTDTILFPLDTIKTRLQAHKSSLKINKSSKLFKGLLPALAGSIPSSAVYWLIYEYSKKKILSNTTNPYLLPLGQIVSVSIADVFTACIRNPFEVLKNTVQVGSYVNTNQAIKGIWQNHGLSGFFMGYKSLLLREIPFDSIEFVIYEYLKRKLVSYKKKEITLVENMILGSIGGALSGFLTTPFDVIKTRSMLMAGSNKQQKISYISFVKTIYQKEGWTIFFSGCWARVMWISIGGALFFGSFEEYKRQISKL